MISARHSLGEDELIRRFQRGDDQVFDRLVEISAPKVMPLISRMVNNAEDAEDILQEVCIDLYTALKRYKWQASYLTFLSQITVNKIKTYYRKKTHRPICFTEIESDTAQSDEPMDARFTARDTTEQLVTQREQQRVLQAILRQLPPEHRLVLVCSDILELSYDETAQVMQVPTGTVKSRLNRARKKFQEHILANRELFGR